MWFPRHCVDPDTLVCLQDELPCLVVFPIQDWAGKNLTKPNLFHDVSIFARIPRHVFRNRKTWREQCHLEKLPIWSVLVTTRLNSPLGDSLRALTPTGNR